MVVLIFLQKYILRIPNGTEQEFLVNYLAGACYDLKQIIHLIKLADSNHDFNPLISTNISNGVAFPTFITVTDIVDLTATSQVFGHMKISLTDDLGNTSDKIINTSGGNVMFDSESGIAMDNINPNRIYILKARLFTDQCVAGHEIEYHISYTHGL